jgi:hypothetical protein
MTIKALDGAINSPLRALDSKELSHIKADLSKLVTNPSMKALWVDNSGHIHQKVSVNGPLTALCYLIDLINQAINGLSNYNLYLPIVMQQEASMTGSEASKVGRLESLHAYLSVMSAKLPGHEELFVERKGQLQLMLNGLLAENHFSSLLKTAAVSAPLFEECSIADRFLRMDPLDLPATCFTRTHVEMIRRLVLSATGEQKEALSEHAARHLCAMEKQNTDPSLKIHLVYAQETVHSDDLVSAAKKYQFIPSALADKPVALAMILAGTLDHMSPFAFEVTAKLMSIKDGPEQFDGLVDRESAKINSPELQDKYFKRVLFLRQVCPKSEKLERVFENLESLAVYGGLSPFCIKELMSSGGIVRGLYTSFHDSLKLEPAERLKSLKELLPIALTLYTKSESQEVGKFIQEVVAKLFAFGSVEEARSTVNSCLADALHENGSKKLEVLLGSLLFASSLNQSNPMFEFVETVFRTVFASKDTLPAVQSLVIQLIESLKTSELPVTSLNLILLEVRNRLDVEATPALITMKELISTALTAWGKSKDTGLDTQFKRKFSEILKFPNGFATLEKLVQLKIKELSKATQEEKIFEARNYLGFYQVELSASKNPELNHLGEAIGEALESANLGRVFNGLQKPYANKAVIQELDRKILDLNLAMYLYNEDGSLKQKPH